MKLEGKFAKCYIWFHIGWSIQGSLTFRVDKIKFIGSIIRSSSFPPLETNNLHVNVALCGLLDKLYGTPILTEEDNHKWFVSLLGGPSSLCERLGDLLSVVLMAKYALFLFRVLDHCAKENISHLIVLGSLTVDQWKQKLINRLDILLTYVFLHLLN